MDKVVLHQNLGQMDGHDFDEPEYNDTNLCKQRCCWWSQPQKSIPVSFCNETSIHGFRFVCLKNRHLTERIFWIISFGLSLTAAVYLIYGIWERYAIVPVMVSFQSNEQDIHTTPFPTFPKTKVRQLQEIARSPRHEKYQEAILQLKFVRHFTRSMCNAQRSFAKHFDFAFNRGTDTDSINHTNTEDEQDEMIDFLFANTIPCDQFIQRCMLGREIRNCSEIFKPIITDYGKCCTFNILPLPLLLNYPQAWGRENSTIYDNPIFGSNGETNWPENEINDWMKWDYGDGFVLDRRSDMPWRQKRAGLPYGLSTLVDPIICTLWDIYDSVSKHNEYYCPLSDSEGMRYLLHTSLEMPHLMELGSVADLNKEILIKVYPDVTNADDVIRRIDPVWKVFKIYS